MPAYLTLVEYRGLSLMPGEDVDALEVRYPGWVAAQLGLASAHMDARLAKRYEIPFAAPYPVAVVGWLVRIVDVRALVKRGVSSSDEQFTLIAEDAKAAAEEIKEAADADKGLYELPLRADTVAQGATRGLPLVYTEASPYVWTDVQRRAGYDEDQRGGGTGG